MTDYSGLPKGTVVRKVAGDQARPLEPCVCPCCGDVLDRMAPIEGVTGALPPAGPSEGDANVCGRCGGISIFSLLPVLHLREPTEAEHAEAMGLLRRGAPDA